MKQIFFVVIVLTAYLISGLSPSSSWAIPLLKIISPVEKQTILGDKITISFIVSEINIGPEGHLLLWLDSTNEEATTATIISNQFDHILAEVPPGPHKLTLELVKTNNKSYTPKIKKTVHFQTKPSQNLAPTETPKSKMLLFLSKINWRAYITTLGIFTLTMGIIIHYRYKRTKF